jgi:cyclomaltodextrinase
VSQGPSTGGSALPPSWVRDAVFYQVFPDRFVRSGRVMPNARFEDWNAPPTRHGFKGGDLYGVSERLDYLADLGVSAIYLNPIFASASNHRYQAYDYLAVDPLLGGDEAFHELLREAHGRGMRVILDGVFNHVGRGFWPFHHVLEAGRHSPYRDWFYLSDRMVRDDLQLRAYPGDRLPGPIPSEWSHEHGAGVLSQDALGYRAWWDLPSLPKLRTSSPEVREHLMGIAEHWIRAGADGWRIDVPEEVEGEGFWEEFRARVKAINPDAYLVGELWRTGPDWCGSRFDGLMNYPLAWAILGFAGSTKLDEDVIAEHAAVAANLRRLDGNSFAARLNQLDATYAPRTVASHLNLLGSHDTPRVATVCGDNRTAVRLAFLLLATLPGAPCIYYGDEIGLTGRIDPGCRGSFPTDEDAGDRELHSFVRALLRVRAAESALRADGVPILAAEGDACAYLRRDETSSIIVAVNAGSAHHRLKIDEHQWPQATVLLTTDGRRIRGQVDPSAGIDVPAGTGAIYRLEA